MQQSSGIPLLDIKALAEPALNYNWYCYLTSISKPIPEWFACEELRLIGVCSDKYSFEIFHHDCHIIYNYSSINTAPIIQRCYQDCRQTFDIRRTKCQNLNVSRLVLELSLRNPLKPCAKSGMKMCLEQQALIELHLGYQQLLIPIEGRLKLELLR